MKNYQIAPAKSMKSNIVVIHLQKIKSESLHFPNPPSNELIESIKQYGVLSPIIVKEINGFYEIIDGKMRYNISRLMRFKSIPAIITNNVKSDMVDISSYYFDKKNCLKCSLKDVTKTSVMCSCKECAEEKHIAYIVEKCMLIKDNQPNIVFADHSNGVNDKAIKRLVNIGCKIIDAQLGLNIFPRSPAKPKRTHYSDITKYVAAQAEYADLMIKYRDAIADIAMHKAMGHDVNLYACIEVKTVKLYFDITKKRSDSDKLTALDQQYLYELNAKEDNTTSRGEREEQTMYFIMLAYLRPEHNSLFNIQTTKLNNDDKLRIVANLNQEEKDLIRRDFIFAHFM